LFLLLFHKKYCVGTHRCVCRSVGDDNLHSVALLKLIGAQQSPVARSLTQNTELEYLDLSVTGRLNINLDLSNCPKLKVLACEESGLTGVTIANLPKLEVADFLWCDGITKLDISGCGKLKTLRVPSGDGFGDLDYLNIDGCVSLAEMHCVNNALKTLDVSHCPALVACLKKGTSDEGETWIKYENGDDYLTVDKDIKLTPAPKS
jgi:hypothetical protein